jgi:hypothetical protein
MPLTSDEFDEYLPRFDDSGNVTEEQGAHRERVSRLLPNFPDGVLGQWVYEHWKDVGQYDWLNFRSLRFEAATWTTEEILQSGAADDPYVSFYRKQLESNDLDVRTGRMATYMMVHGTWPAMPLLLANPRGAIRWPGGEELFGPFHLLEGRHRVGVLAALSARGKVASCHGIWCVTASSAASYGLPPKGKGPIKGFDC